ncbi:MAG: S8 family serine peptidase [Thermoleophilia bacterium]
MITRRGIRGALVALAAAAALPAAASAASPSWVPGEVLVGAPDAAVVGGEQVGAPAAGIRLVRTGPAETVPDAVARLRAVPGVRWAEPNRIVSAAAVPNDPFAGEEYWFNNAGQINGGRVAGLPDADADVPEAWAITRGSPSVVVAVVDGGIAYDSPDLASAVWTNPGETGGGRESNGVDDDRDGLVDDWRGWDWRDDDNDPRDLGLFPHGTAVSGIIGARADDGYGIAGVAPLTRIMPLRVNSPSGSATISDVVAAFGYAQRMGARVVNASFGGPTPSSAEQAAIAAAPGVLFVTSAGNDGIDMDAGDPNYPCAFDLPNVICVAATDERDGLAAFSNRGARTVDLAAPGVGVLTTAPPWAELAADDFETPLEGRWITGGTGGTWQRTTERAASGAWSIADSPSGPYGNDVSHWIQWAAPVDLSNRVGCRIDVQYRSQTVNPDGLYFETSTNGGASWSQQDTLTGDTGGEFISGDGDITPAQGRPSVLFRLRMSSNASVTGDGFDIDDVALRCVGGTPDGRDLIYASGTSFAAPVVSGIAALLLAQKPTLTVAELRAAILAGVDPLPSLAGRVATGGRASARRALEAVGATPPASSTATLTDPGRVTRLVVRRARSGAVTLSATIAGRATGATGLLMRGPAIVKRLAAARSGAVTLALGRLAPGTYRVTLAPRDPVTSAVRGTRTATFTVPARRAAPARRAKRAQEVTSDNTGAAGYRLPATPQPLDAAASAATGGSVAGDPVAHGIGAALEGLLGIRPVARTLVESRIGDLAAAATAAGGATLAPGGAAAAALPSPHRGARVPVRVAGRGPRVAALRAALVAHSANEADAAALARALGVLATRVRAAAAAGDLAGVAQGLRDAGLLAPSLGDAVARRPALRRAVARTAARAGRSVPRMLRNPAQDRADQRLATGLRRFASLG